jgi:hypothetical protein
LDPTEVTAPGLGKALGVADRQVLAAAIAVMHEPLKILLAPEGYVFSGSSP